MVSCFEHYQRAVGLQPDFAPLQDALANLLTRQGLALAEQGRREEAVTYLQRSLRLRPFDRTTQRALHRATAGNESLSREGESP